MFSRRAMTAFSVTTAVTLIAGTAVPTPLYHTYQMTLGLSAVTVTIIFASYAYSVLAALLTAGSLSDYLGRKPMIVAAMGLSVISLLMFLTANSAWSLIIARVMQGFAIGIGTTTLGAAILDTDRPHAPMLNGVVNFIGLAAGAATAGVLVSFAPFPTRLVFIVLLVLLLLEATILVFMPETTTRRAGAVRALIPRVGLPGSTRQTFARITPVNIAAWALGGFYLSLMPTLVITATHLTLPLVGASVVALLMVSAAVSVVLLRNTDARRELIGASIFLTLGVLVTLAGVAASNVVLLLGGAMIAGLGYGASFSGTLRSLLPLVGPDSRAGLLATFYVESYLALSVPAIIAGLVSPVVGLAATAYCYGGVVIVLTTISFVATLRARLLGVGVRRFRDARNSRS